MQAEGGETDGKMGLKHPATQLSPRRCGLIFAALNFIMIYLPNKISKWEWIIYIKLTNETWTGHSQEPINKVRVKS